MWFNDARTQLIDLVQKLRKCADLDVNAIQAKLDFPHATTQHGCCMVRANVKEAADRQPASG